jgi:ribosome-associated protein
VVIQVSEETRSQARNREIARERLADLVTAGDGGAEEAPADSKPTQAGRWSGGSRRRRRRGEVKGLRGKVEE